MAARIDRRLVALELAVEFCSEVRCEVDVHAPAKREHICHGALIEQRSGGVGISAILVDDLVAAIEQVAVRVEDLPVRPLDLEPGEEIALSGERAGVHGIGAAQLSRGVKALIGLEADVEPGGQAQISAVGEAGIRAREAAKRREMDRLRCSGRSLGGDKARVHREETTERKVQQGYCATADVQSGS